MDAIGKEKRCPIMQQTPPKKVTIWNKTFICCVLANMFLYTSQAIVNPLVTTYAAYIGASASIVGMISGFYFGVSFAMKPASGPMVSLLDKKKLMIFTYAVGVVANLGYAASQTVGLFIASRALHGVQFSLLGALTLTVASDSLPKEKLGSGLGIFGLSGIFGNAFGPSLGLMLQAWGDKVFGAGGGFRLTFLIAAAITLLSIIPCLVMDAPPKPDRKTMAALGPWYKNIVNLDALPSAIMMAFYCMSAGLYNTFLVPYAAQYGIEGIGLFFTVNAIASLVSRPISGQLLDKKGIAFVFYPCTVLSIFALLLVGLVHALPAVLVAGAITGISWGTLSPAMQSMSMQVVTPAKRGVASNTSYLGMDLGFFLGPTLAGLVVAHTDSYGTMFVSAIIPYIIGVIVFALSWKHYKTRVAAVQREMASTEQVKNE